MTKKHLVHIIGFCLAVCVMLTFLCALFETSNNKNYITRYHAYRNYPEDTVDAVFLGTSGVDRYWVASKAYEDYGMTVYPLSTDAMPAWLYTYLLEYALTYQDPQLLVVDIRAFCQDNEVEIMDVRARRFLDAMVLFSPLWFKTAFKTMECIHYADESRDRFDVSLLLSFVRLHDEWVEIDRDYFSRKLGSFTHEYNGFYMSPTNSMRATPQQPLEIVDEKEAPDYLSMQAFYDFIAAVEESGVEVLFVNTPQFQDEMEMKRANFIYDLLDELGYKYIHWYSDASDNIFTLDLDPETDFYNAGHVNFRGAQIFTEDFAAYLNENYQLPDRRNDEAVKEHWDGVYDRILETMDSYEAQQAANAAVEEEPEDAGIE